MLSTPGHTGGRPAEPQQEIDQITKREKLEGGRLTRAVGRHIAVEVAVKIRFGVHPHKSHDTLNNKNH